jgi:hypothetical protein
MGEVGEVGEDGGMGGSGMGRVSVMEFVSGVVSITTNGDDSHEQPIRIYDSRFPATVPLQWPGIGALEDGYHL